MLTYEYNRALLCPLDLLSASSANVLDSAYAQSLAASSAQSCRCPRYWFHFQESNNLRLRKLFSEDIAPHPKMGTDMPVTMRLSSVQISDVILQDRISPPWPSLGSVHLPRDLNNANTAERWIARLTAAPSSATSVWNIDCRLFQVFLSFCLILLLLGPTAHVVLVTLAGLIHPKIGIVLPSRTTFRNFRTCCTANDLPPSRLCRPSGDAQGYLASTRKPLLLHGGSVDTPYSLVSMK